jgi:hypothetical protein
VWEEKDKVVLELHTEFNQGRLEMEGKKTKYLKVKDKAGNEFLCPLNALKSVEDATSGNGGVRGGGRRRTLRRRY